MRIALAVLALVATTASPVAAERRVAEPSGLPPGRLLWIGAHPDDEIILALDALARLPDPPPVFLLEDRVRIAPGAATVRFSSALPHDPDLLSWNANGARAEGRGTLWSFVLGDAMLQPSQMDSHFLAALRVVPRQTRRIYLLPAVERSSDPTPVDGCP